MAKVAGLLQNMYVGGYDLSGDVGSVDEVIVSRQTINVTAINVSSTERILGRKDGQIGFTSHFNTAAGQSHPVLAAMPTTDTQVISTIGTTIGDPAAAMANAKQISYPWTRADDGKVTAKVSAVADSYGVEWGRLLTAGLRTDSGATNGTSYDAGASSAFGLQAYLQVTALTGTNVVVTIEESSDDGAADAFAAVTGGAFTSVTAVPAFERIATSTGLTVERYLRVATSGTFTSATFAVVVVRNNSAPVF